jgi:hypothetical protein
MMNDRHAPFGAGVTDCPSALLSDYLDGDLPPARRAKLEAHLAVCPGCRATLDELRALAGLSAAMRDDESDPASDLWPGIRGRLRPRTARWRWLRGILPAAGPAVSWKPALAAAAVVVVVLATSLLVWRAGGPPAAPAGGTARAPGAPAPLESRPFEASAEYYDTVAALRRTVETRLTHDPKVIEVLEENLDVLDMAIAQYVDALAEEPGDARLAERLEAARKRKIEVLRQAADLSEAGN